MVPQSRKSAFLEFEMNHLKNLHQSKVLELILHLLGMR